MAKSRRKAGGATRGRFRLKKMGKGWSSQRPKLGFRPKPKAKPKAGDGEQGSAGKGEDS